MIVDLGRQLNHQAVGMIRYTVLPMFIKKAADYINVVPIRQDPCIGKVFRQQALEPEHYIRLAMRLYDVS